MPVLIVPAIAVAIAALLALVLIYAWRQFGHSIAQLIPNISVGTVTIPLRSLVVDLIDASADTVEKYLDAALQPIAKVIAYPVHAIEYLITEGNDAIAELVTSARWIITTYVPRQIKLALSVSAVSIVALAATVKRDYSNLIGHITKAITTTEAYAHTRIVNVEDRITRSVKALEASIASTAARILPDVHKVRAEAETYAAGLVGTLSSTVAKDVTNLGATITAQAKADTAALSSAIAGVDAKITAAITTASATAIGVISTDIDKIATGYEADIADAVGAVAGVAAGDFGDIMEWVNDIDLTKVLDIAGVTTLSIATAGALTRYLEECGMPNCRNLSAIGRALQDLFGLVEGGAFLAVLAEMIADPIDAAHDAQSFLTPLVNPLVDGARDILGVS